MKTTDNSKIVPITGNVERKDLRASIENQLQNMQSASFTSVMVTDIVLNNGRNSSMVTLFNSNDVDFEDLQIGISTAICRQNMGNYRGGVSSKKTDVYSIVNGKLELSIGFPKVDFSPMSKAV